MTANRDNTAERLRQLLLEIYVSTSIRDTFPQDEYVRIMDTILAAAEGQPFDDLGLPFPRDP